MAQNQMNKYVWLVDTIHRAGKISLEDINRKWLDNDLSEGIEIPKRTFHKWRIAIEEMSVSLSRMRIAANIAISFSMMMRLKRRV